ncbi:MAG: hypothetical protein IJY25_00105, partial [Bacilli bacterium]|nr:hypothetical protein [Bacilli bacterium]
SSSLLIKSSLSVDPDSSTFSVVFSSSSTALETNAITPTVNPTTLTATKATIDNSGTYPTIENLSATFTEPGDSVSYTFYARNTGKYDAYLTSIVFQNLEIGVFKNCIAMPGTSETLVASACNSISATVTVGSESATSTTLGIEDHELLQGNSETVTITLSYGSNGTRADGPFEVNFGNIYLTYGTQETSEMPVLPEASTCILSNDVADENFNNTIGAIGVGDEVTCGSESFYVIPNDTVAHPESVEGTVALLSKYNLNVGNDTVEGTLGIQNASATGAVSNLEGNNLDFSYCNFTEEEMNEAYSGTFDDIIAFNEWAGCNGTVAFASFEDYISTGTTYWGEVDSGTFIYNSNATPFTYVENYGNILKKMGMKVIISTLPSNNQLINLGCSTSDNSCTNAPSWVYSTSYWSGSAFDDDFVWIVASGGIFDDGDFFSAFFSGVRPVVIISESDIRVS